MDNTNTERQQKGDSAINRLMVDDARQSFFQLENLMSSLDTKAFGVVAIGAVLISIYTYILNNFPENDNCICHIRY